MTRSTDWEYQENALVPEGKSLPEGHKRIAAVVEYDGSFFSGWQKQSHSPSVQQAVEQALSSVANTPIHIACAGRTDAQVHATNQVIHFDTAVERNPRNWVLGSNANLPDSVRLHMAAEVSPQFHARYTATARTYRYVIYNGPCRPAVGPQYLTWHRKPLDAGLMNEAAQCLLGENDFSSFRAAGCQSVSPNRHMYYLQVWRQGELVIIELKANAFLHHMVRNIAGVLIAVGNGSRSVESVQQLLELRDRNKGEVTAPANGLYLVAVDYPSPFTFENLKPGPFFVDRELYSSVVVEQRIC